MDTTTIRPQYHDDGEDTPAPAASYRPVSRASSRFSFSPDGMRYATWTVTRRADEAVIGILWKTREGYNFRAAAVDGATGSRFGETLGVSRETAGGLLGSRYDRLVAEAAEVALAETDVTICPLHGATCESWPS